MATGYLMQAINLYDSIPIKTVRPIMTGKVVDASPQELHIQYRENAYAFVFRFGAVVFFNLTNDEIDREVNNIRSVLGPGLSQPTNETYQINLGDGSYKVEFDYVELKKISIEQLRLIAETLGQSAALEFFEISTDGMLNDTSEFMTKAAKAGRVPFQSNRLIRIIGSTASTRQHIISNVSILDPPEETWKSKELEKLYRELQQNFDIDLRFRTLDRKLMLIQDNIEILADLASTRRMTFLEASIVILIIFEIVMAMVKGV